MSQLQLPLETMHIQKSMLLAALTLMLGGCATNQTRNAPTVVAERMKVVDSEFSAARMFVAPELSGSGDDSFLAPTYDAQLVAVQDKGTGRIQHALSVKWTYTSQGWIFFRRATLPGAVSLPTASGKREVTSCSGRTCIYVENLTSEIASDVLSSSAATGLRVLYSGDGGQGIIQIPANYIAGYLAGSDGLAKR